MQTTPSEEIRVVLPGSVAPIRLPAGWSQAFQKTGAVTIIGPEGDLRVAFIVCALDGTLEEIGRRAWRVFDPGLDFPVRQKIPMPGSGGWDAILQIVYNVPVAESRSAVAVLRTLRDRAYITLILGAKASLSRRMAQIWEVLESWKPEGLSPPNLSGRYFAGVRNTVHRVRRTVGAARRQSLCLHAHAATAHTISRLACRVHSTSPRTFRGIHCALHSC